MEHKRIGFAITGSFCTFAAVLPVLERLCARNEVTAILSPAPAQTIAGAVRCRSGKAAARCAPVSC